MKITSFPKASVPQSLNPGMAIRAAQQELETDIARLIAAFGERVGASVAEIHIEYLNSGDRGGVARNAPLVRLTIET